MNTWGSLRKYYNSQHDTSSDPNELMQIWRGPCGSSSSPGNRHREVVRVARVLPIEAEYCVALETNRSEEQCGRTHSELDISSELMMQSACISL